MFRITNRFINQTNNINQTKRLISTYNNRPNMRPEDLLFSFLAGYFAGYVVFNKK